jgi:predicted PurR-regulated permease PerM
VDRSEYVRRLWIAAGVAIVAALSVLYLLELAHLLLILFAGLLAAVVMDGLARAVHRRLPVPRKVALVTGFVLAVTGLAAFFWWSGPRIAEQLDSLLNRIPEVVGNLAGRARSTDLGRDLLSRGAGAGPVAMLPSGRQVVGGVTGVFTSVVGAASSAAIVTFLGVYLAWDPDLYRSAVLRMAPEGERRDRLERMFETTSHTLRRWMVARLVSMSVVGVLTGAALAVAGVPLALALGLIAGVLAFVPFIGPILALLPAVLVGFGQSSRTALVVVLIYVGVQAVESYLITPVVEKEAVYLPPAFLIAAQVIMGTLFGLVGVFLATPIAVTGVVLVRTVYLGGVLDQDVEPLTG